VKTDDERALFEKGEVTKRLDGAPGAGLNAKQLKILVDERLHAFVERKRGKKATLAPVLV
jgi:hypothetical protein